MKTKKSIFYVIVLIISFNAINACKKDVNTTSNLPYTHPDEVGYYPNGFGTFSGIPVCKPFELPPNVEFLGLIQSSTFIKSDKFNKLTQEKNPKDSTLYIGAGALKFYFKLLNKNSSKQRIIIPGGLIFYCHDTSSQNATTTQNDTIIIPPHDTLTIFLHAFCTNKQRTFKNDIYDILGTTLHQNLFELIQILKSKQKLDYTQVSYIQDIIWNITNGSGMTDADRAYLNSLP